jgi:hypothetical protein
VVIRPDQRHKLSVLARNITGLEVSKFRRPSSVGGAETDCVTVTCLGMVGPAKSKQRHAMVCLNSARRFI